MNHTKRTTNLYRVLLLGLLLGGAMVQTFVFPSTAHAASLSEQLPDIGKAGTSVLSPREEQLLGREFMRSVQHNLKLVDDPLMVAYLQNLADRLVSSLQGNQPPITVFLVDDPSINAFAGPGGYIGIHTGLLLASRSEGELASVVAHEIAHVTQRHLVRSFEASSRMSLPTMGALIAAIVLGASNPEAGEAVLATAMASSTQQQLTHSRSNEQEADNIGLDLLVNANYDPRDMVKFFEVLQSNQRLVESAAPEFMRTHPLTVGRIADARNRAEQYDVQISPDNSTFELMQARSILLSGENNTATLSANLDKTTWNTETQQYFSALAAAKKGDFKQARKTLQQLIQKSGNHRVLFPYSAAQIELADEQAQSAKRIIEQALKLFPGNLSLTELYAITLLRLNQAQQTMDVLRIALRKNPEQYRLYQIYAKAANTIGQQAEAYRALAEWQYGHGNIYQAVDYLQQALQSPGLPPYDRLTLQARQDMLKSEVKQREGPIEKTNEEHLKWTKS